MEQEAVTKTRRTSPSRYLGKLCEQHPEEGGERHIKSYLCCKCAREKKKLRRRAQELERLQERIEAQGRHEAPVAHVSRETQTEGVDPLSNPLHRSETLPGVA